jgi:small GTP-binding protein
MMMADSSMGTELPRGLRRRASLSGHAKAVNEIVWSRDGQMLASASDDATIHLWDTHSGELRRAVETSVPITSLAWSPKGDLIAGGYDDGRICIWDAETGQLYATLPGFSTPVRTLAWSPATVIAAGYADRKIRLWTAERTKPRRTLESHSHAVGTLAWSPDGRTLASGSVDHTVRLWDGKSNDYFAILRGHSSWVNSVAWSPDGSLLATGSDDATIRLWDVATGRETSIIEGHTSWVHSVSLSHDGMFCASSSLDGTLRLWRTDTWQCVAVLPEPPAEGRDVSFHPTKPILAALRGGGAEIQLFDLEVESLLRVMPTSPSVGYTTAKVMLVGDTGVGKTGLATVLSGRAYEPTESTHGRRTLTLPSCEHTLVDGTKMTCEVFLWDLAGQPGYRLIHQLHLNDVAVALVVFDARSETDPFAGVLYWDKAIQQARLLQGNPIPPTKKLLVLARADRGGVSASQASIEALCRERGFDGYFETSAREGWGIQELLDAIRGAIDVGSLPTVTSTVLFQHIKSFLIEQKNAGLLLASVSDLYQDFQEREVSAHDAADVRAEFEICIGLLESHNLIKRLSFGDLILLQPEYLDTYASALVNAAKTEPHGLGSIREEDALAGNFRLARDERIPNQGDERLLLRATVEDLLRYEIAFPEEEVNGGSHLIFPSQITRERPDLPDPAGKAVVFTFEGPVQTIYATLAVRLSYSGFFQEREMWRNAITYTAQGNGTYGMFLRELGEGSGELALFFDAQASADLRAGFEDFVHTHLKRRALPLSISSKRVIECPSCGTPVTDLAIQRRRALGFNWMPCNVCETRISPLEPEDASSDLTRDMDRMADSERDKAVERASIRGWIESERQGRSPFPTLQLASEELNTLADILADAYQFKDASPHARRVLINRAGLSHVLSDMELGGSAPNVAFDIMWRLRTHGPLSGARGDEPKIHPIGALLREILKMTGLPREQQVYVADVIVRYRLVEDPPYIDYLHAEYSNLAEQEAR